MRCMTQDIRHHCRVEVPVESDSEGLDYWGPRNEQAGSCASKILGNKPPCRTRNTHALHLSKTCEDYKKARQVKRPYLFQLVVFRL